MTKLDQIKSIAHEFLEETANYFYIIGELIRDLPRPWGPPQFTMNEVFDLEGSEGNGT